MQDFFNHLTVSASDLVYITLVLLGAIAWFIKLERDVRANTKALATFAETMKACKSVQDHRQEISQAQFSEIMRSLGRVEGALARLNGRKEKENET